MAIPAASQSIHPVTLSGLPVTSAQSHKNKAPSVETTTPQPLTQPRQDVLAIDGKLYVETTPQQLLYEKHRMMERQHRQPAWVNNLVQSAIFAGVFSALHTTVSVIQDSINKVSFNLPERATQFVGYFAISTAGLFIGNSILQAIRNKQDQ